MDTVNPASGESADTPHPETEAERQRRLAWEAEGIAAAEASLAAGLYVDADDIDAWIDSIGTDNEMPPPPTRRR
jgi:predicted transcriptional regulator